MENKGVHFRSVLSSKSLIPPCHTNIQYIRTIVSGRHSSSFFILLGHLQISATIDCHLVQWLTHSLCEFNAKNTHTHTQTTILMSFNDYWLLTLLLLLLSIELLARIDFGTYRMNENYIHYFWAFVWLLKQNALYTSPRCSTYIYVCVCLISMARV